MIPIDAIYSPVQRVRYNIEETRVGQRTNYDKLVHLEIWTDGTVHPEMALVEAGKIFRKHLNPFVQYFELGEERVSDEAAAAAGVDEELIRKLNMPISDMELSPSGRATAWSRPGSTPSPSSSSTPNRTCSSSAASAARPCVRSSASSRTSSSIWAWTLPEGYQMQSTGCRRSKTSFNAARIRKARHVSFIS